MTVVHGFDCGTWWRELLSQQSGKQPARRPADRNVRCLLELCLNQDTQDEGTPGLVIIKCRVLMIRVEAHAGVGFGDSPDGKVSATIPVKELLVTLWRGQTDLLVLAQVHCYAKDQTARNKWVAVLRRMQILICEATKTGDRRLILTLAMVLGSAPCSPNEKTLEAPLQWKKPKSDPLFVVDSDAREAARPVKRLSEKVKDRLAEIKNQERPESCSPRQRVILKSDTY